MNSESTIGHTWTPTAGSKAIGLIASLAWLSCALYVDVRFLPQFAAPLAQSLVDGKILAPPSDVTRAWAIAVLVAMTVSMYLLRFREPSGSTWRANADLLLPILPGAVVLLVLGLACNLRLFVFA